MARCYQRVPPVACDIFGGIFSDATESFTSDFRLAGDDLGYLSILAPTITAKLTLLYFFVLLIHKSHPSASNIINMYIQDARCLY